MRKFKVVIEKTSTGYSAYADNIAVYSTGGTVKELVANMVEAINFYLDEAGYNKNITYRSLDLRFSIPSLFHLYPINVRHFAERIGINYTLLSQYVQGRKKPSEKQTERIVEGLQEIGRELSEVSLVKS